MAPLVWLVTGCSSGFGEIFVHRLLARGDKVIATGRNVSERLAHLKETGAKILDLDVSSPQEVLNAKVEEAIKFYDGIDVLVNNAGYVEAGLAEDVRWVPKALLLSSTRKPAIVLYPSQQRTMARSDQHQSLWVCQYDPRHPPPLPREEVRKDCCDRLLRRLVR